MRTSLDAVDSKVAVLCNIECKSRQCPCVVYFILTGTCYMRDCGTTCGGLVVRALDSGPRGREFKLPASALPSNNSGQVVHTYVPV